MVPTLHVPGYKRKEHERIQPASFSSEWVGTVRAKKGYINTWATTLTGSISFPASTAFRATKSAMFAPQLTPRRTHLFQKYQANLRRIPCEKMGDHVVLSLDLLRKPRKVNTIRGGEDSAPNFSSSLVSGSGGEGENLIGDEEEPLIQSVDCRICQEEDHVENLEVPCACNGSLKIPDRVDRHALLHGFQCIKLIYVFQYVYTLVIVWITMLLSGGHVNTIKQKQILGLDSPMYAHRACIQRWCNEKGDTTCEICHEQYKPGYTTPPRIHFDDTTIDINWLITGSALDLHDRHVLTMRAAHHHLVEGDYDGYASNDSGAVFCRSVTLILMALLLLRHALIINNADGNEDDSDVEDASAYFSLFLLRALGFLLPCYFMAWIITIMQRQRERQVKSFGMLEIPPLATILLKLTTLSIRSIEILVRMLSSTKVECTSLVHVKVELSRS
ncbi:hypothetical protein ZIOFF_039759 [Zingiber officinale]|uniref:RING-CH-type domain-containing protein n=1 Tax=Zingiber officinale TaxID=94328 RepID=A0A8J5L418_ZINOF|nr:hypothetical protein ZIOFF_039759 [Zingiber officinale]